MMICEPVETPDTSAFVQNLPTTSRSTAPYVACRNMANSTGSMKRMSFGRIASLVKSLFFIVLSKRKPDKTAASVRAALSGIAFL